MNTWSLPVRSLWTLAMRTSDVASVGDGGVGTGNYDLCNSNSRGGGDLGGGGSFGIRPIVVLPSDIEVEKNESGQWDIAY